LPVPDRVTGAHLPAGLCGRCVVRSIQGGGLPSLGVDPTLRKIVVWLGTSAPSAAACLSALSSGVVLASSDLSGPVD
jgi:hypothetical protein